MRKLQILVFSFFIAGVYFLIALICHIAVTRISASSECIVSAEGLIIDYKKGIYYVS